MRFLRRKSCNFGEHTRLCRLLAHNLYYSVRIRQQLIQNLNVRFRLESGPSGTSTIAELACGLGLNQTLRGGLIFDN